MKQRHELRPNKVAQLHPAPYSPWPGRDLRPTEALRSPRHIGPGPRAEDQVWARAVIKILKHHARQARSKLHRRQFFNSQTGADITRYLLDSKHRSRKVHWYGERGNDRRRTKRAGPQRDGDSRGCSVVASLRDRTTASDRYSSNIIIMEPLRHWPAYQA